MTRDKHKLPLRSVLILMIVSLLSVVSNSVEAHHPHDIVDALAVSPRFAQDKTLYVANTGYLLKSEDGGYSWKELANGLTHNSPISDILITPAGSGDRQSRVYIATEGDGVYRSVDNGGSWTAVNQGISNLSIQRLSVSRGGHVVAIDTAGKINILADSGNAWTRADLPDQALASALSSDTAGGQLLAGSRTGDIFVLSEPDNGWKLAGKLPENVEITALAAGPAGKSLFVGTREAGLFVSHDAGASFEPLYKELAEQYIVSIVLSPAYEQDHTLYVSAREQALYVSHDEGTSWKLQSDGLTRSDQANAAIYRSPHFRTLAIAGDKQDTFFLAGFDGLFVSVDHGVHWEELQTRPVSLIKALDISPADSSNRHSIAIGTYGGGAYVSHTGGDDWIIANRGLNTTRIGDISFSPAYGADDTLYSSAKGYLLQSDNRGGSWEQIPVSYQSLRKRIVNKLIKLGLPRETGKELLAFKEIQPVYPNAVTLSPDFATDNSLFIGTRYHGLYHMDSTTRLPEAVWDKPQMVITTIELSPGFTRDGLAFLFVRGDGLYRSDDHGTSWNKVSTGVLDDSSTTDPRGLYALKYLHIGFSPAFSTDGTLYIAGPQGLYRSTDRGLSWHTIATESLGEQPNILAFGISPGFANDRTLVTSVKGKGLYRSTDGGEQFRGIGQSLIDDNQSIDLVGFSGDFARDHTLYAASDQTVFKSVDSGDNWIALDRPVRYEDRRDAITYTGKWRSIESRGFSASTVHITETPGSAASLKFSGCGIRWLALTSPQGTKAEVYLDDLPVTIVDLHAAAQTPIAEVYVNNDLACGPHSIRIALPEGSPGHLSLDAFDVLPDN